MWIFYLFLYSVIVGIVYKLSVNANDDAVWIALCWPFWLVLMPLFIFIYFGIYTGIFLINLCFYDKNQ